jgi:hypothetical protein
MDLFEDAAVVKVDAHHGVIGLGSLGFLLNVHHLAPA